MSQASHKIAMYRVAAWLLGPTGQWLSMDHHSSTIVHESEQVLSTTQGEKMRVISDGRLCEILFKFT